MNSRYNLKHLLLNKQREFLFECFYFFTGCDNRVPGYVSRASSRFLHDSSRTADAYTRLPYLTKIEVNLFYSQG